MKNKIIFLLIVFMIFSLINNYSAFFIMDSYQNYFIKELIWYILGFFIIYLMAKVNIEILFKYSFYFYILGNLLLLLTLFIGTNVNGSTSWIDLGPFNYQASEFMKIFILMFLYYFSTINKKLSDWKYIVYSFGIILIPSILTFLEPDTGAVLIYFIIYLAFLIDRKLNKWWYILSVLFILIIGSSFFILYFNCQDLFIKIFGTSFFYRMDRITSFINGEGYQINKALISIGSSGLFGKGLKHMPEYFPEAPTDFAFALLIKNIGFVGILIFVLSYAALIYFLIKMINKQNKTFLFPVIILLIFQSSVNIFMNIGLFPIIGITLPFISYGGSNLLSYMLIIGLVLNIKKVSIDTY